MVQKTVACLALAAMVVTAGEAVAQRGGGGRGGGRRGGSMNVSPEMQARMQAARALPLEAMWAALSLVADVPDTQVVRLLPGMRRAWKERSDVLQFAEKNDAWEMANDKLKVARKRLDGEIRSTLTKDQRKSYERALKVGLDSRKSGTVRPPMGR